VASGSAGGLILHAFVKKSRETPDRELKIARKRMKEIGNG